MTESLTHIKRTQLPWRNNDGLTECGRDAGQYPSQTRDEAVAAHKKLGQQRFAIVTCMTCMRKANVEYKVESDYGILPILEREIRRVSWQNRDDRQQLVDEFDAIVALIDAHRDEFDDFLKAKAETVSLSDARARKQAKARYTQ